MRKQLRLVAACAAVWVGGSAVSAEELPPPSKLVQQMNQPNTDADPAASFKQKAEALAAEVKTLPAEQAAERWLALFDAEPSASPSDVPWQQFGSTNDDALMNALPPPTAWKALSEAIKARPIPEAGKGNYARRRETALHALGRLLAGDAKAAGDFADELITLAGRNHGVRRMNNGQSLRTLIAGTVEKPEDAVTAFEADLANATQAVGAVQSLDVPDLVTLIGEQQARKLLETAVVASVKLDVEVGDKTRKLAQDIALERISELKVPQWSLVTADSIQLYKALDRKFVVRRNGGMLGGLIGRRNPTYDPYSYERRSAQQQYLLGLIIAGRTEDAIKLLTMPGTDENPAPTLNVHNLSVLDEAGHTQKVFDTVDAMLAKNPDLPVWKFYQSLAARAGQTDKLVDRARDALKNADPKLSQVQYIRVHLVEALLAADRLNEAAEVAETVFADPDTGSGLKTELSLQWVTAGRLTKNPAWVDRGLKVAAESRTAEVGDVIKQYERSQRATQYITELSLNGRSAEALTAIAEELRDKPEAERNDSSTLLAAAAGIYHAAGQHAAVLEMLQTVPYWGADDLSELLDRSGRGRSVGVMAATALLETGKKDQARKAVDALLHADPGNDDVYALLVKIDGPAAIARLDEQFARDQFEERPLIWKAHVQKQQGDLASAEATAKAAIAIDPSDGDTGHDDRMRVYAVLADVLEAKGDINAKFFRGVVEAIRTSEAADDLWSAGLLKQAVALYEKSLTHFADAYCIQSRLAIKMSELGMHELAAAHYKKAYELMPDSFGRVESHCFGCEKAFAGSVAQKLAESVFTAAAQKTPNKPQVHYLLGYLRESQDRNVEAMENYKTAVKLDPAYLNAWKKMLGIGEQVHIPQADLDAAALAILKLDPLGRHGNGSLEKVRDLAGLWQAVEAAQRFKSPATGLLLPLTASAAERAKDKELQSSRRYYRSNHGESLPTPAAAVAGTVPVATLRALMQSNGE